MTEVSKDRARRLAHLYDVENLEHIRVALHKLAIDMERQEEALLATLYHDLASEFQAAKEYV